MVFEPGSAVEVNIHGFVGLGTSWFSATIVTRVDSDTYLVQYPNVVRKATVSFRHLRPLPPPDTRRIFHYGQKVEAFCEDHWREGQITTELWDGRFLVSFGDSEDEDDDDSEEQKEESSGEEEMEMDLDEWYSGTFVKERLETPMETSESEEVDDSEDENVFPKELLRIHRQWVNENWYPPITPYNGRDLISDLPDAVLLHIMNNFMFTKDAVRTCVLSRRWKNLSKQLTDLSFNGTLIVCGHDVECFKKFATWLLFSRDHSCSLLNLTLFCENEPQLLDSVIKYALLHNVHNLKVTGRAMSPNSDSLRLVFSSQTLTSLDICIAQLPFHNSFTVILPKSLHLPAIKTLRLNYVKFTCSTDNHSAEPFSNCRALHTLSLSNCYLHDDAQLSISNSTLSNLTIFLLSAKQIVLSTPNLTSINIFASLPHQLSSKCTLSLLEEVDVDLGLEFYDGDAIMGWLQVLANVKILTMCAHALRILHGEFSNLISMKAEPPSFARLELLVVKQRDFLTISNKKVNALLEYLLQNSPMSTVDIFLDHIHT